MSNISDSDTVNNGISDANNSSLLQAIGQVSSLLLTIEDNDLIDSVLISALEIIGTAVNADRVHIWRDMKLEGEHKMERLYSWVSEYAISTPSIPSTTVDAAEYLPQWLDAFSHGQWVGGPVSSLSKKGQEIIAPFGIKTISVIPMKINKLFWGFITIGDCKSEHTIEEDEISFLRTTALMVAGAINHHRAVMEFIAINHRADAANRSKNAFLSNMSHEVRTPLNAIVGMANVGRQAQEISEKNHALEQIEDASAHLLDIISNVLDMAQIEEGKLELNPTEYVFRDLVDKALSTVKPLASEKCQSLEIDIDEDIPVYVIGDDRRLSQLITNLTSNAVKFTPIYGRINMNVNVLDQTPEHLKLEIVVKDNGVGIPEEQRSKLFTAFEQAHGALNRDYGGTGLGLPIAKRIVELMDGSIKVDSEQNRGTTVLVTIQLAKSNKDNLAPASADSKSNSKSKSAGETDSRIVPGEFKGKRLLIVEDIEINREILIALLKGSELIIECAEDGQIALDMVMFNIEKYDIIFMDLQMPNMGGLESARQIRELGERTRGHLPIIAMTANVFANDIRACMEAGMDDHLSKPLDIEKVLEMLRKYLG